MILILTMFVCVTEDLKKVNLLRSSINVLIAFCLIIFCFVIAFTFMEKVNSSLDDYKKLK